MHASNLLIEKVLLLSRLESETQMLSSYWCGELTYLMWRLWGIFFSQTATEISTGFLYLMDTRHILEEECLDMCRCRDTKPRYFKVNPQWSSENTSQGYLLPEILSIHTTLSITLLFYDDVSVWLLYLEEACRILKCNSRGRWRGGKSSWVYVWASEYYWSSWVTECGLSRVEDGGYLFDVLI